MAENLELNLNINTGGADNSINSITERLAELKSKIGDVGVGSAEFAKLKQEIVAADTKLKNLNKSIEGVDTERLVGEIGKFAGGMTQAFAGVSLMVGKGNKSLEEMQKQLSNAIGVVMAVKGAMDAFTAATNLAKVAQIALNSSMKATIFGAIAAAVIALVFALKDFYDQQQELIKASGDFDNALAGNIQSIKDFNQNSKDMADAAEDAALRYRVAVGDLTQAQYDLMKMNKEADKYKDISYQKAVTAVKEIASLRDADLVATAEYYDNILEKAGLSLSQREQLEQEKADALTKINDQAGNKMREIWRQYGIDIRNINKKNANDIKIEEEKEAKRKADEAKKAADEAKRKAEEERRRREEKLRGEMSLADKLRQLKIDQIYDDQKREQEQAKFDFDMNIRAITNEIKELGYGKEKEKDLLIEYTKWYEEKYIDVLVDIDNKYYKEKVKKEDETIKELESLGLEFSMSYVDKAFDVLDKIEEKEEAIKSSVKNFSNVLKGLFDIDTFNFMNDGIVNIFQSTFDQIIPMFENFSEKGTKDIEKVKATLIAFASIMQSVFQAMQQKNQQNLEENLSRNEESFEKNKESVQKAYYNQLLSKAEYDAKVEALEEQRLMKEKRLKHQAFEREKKASMTNATINGIVAAVAALSTTPVWLGIVMSALVGATAAVQVGMIAAEKNPYARGGVLKGPSHADGGILTQFGELEGEEGVINKKSMSIPKLRSIASRVNMAGGGVAFPETNNISIIDKNDLQAIVSASNAVPVVVSENNITTTQRKVAVTQKRNKL